MNDVYSIKNLLNPERSTTVRLSKRRTGLVGKPRFVTSNLANLSAERANSCDIATNSQSVDIVCALISEDALEIHEMPNR